MGDQPLVDQREWKDLTDTEKIDRLRDELRNFRYIVSRIAELERKVHLLRLHQHGENGAVVVRIESADSQSILSGQVMTLDKLR